MELRGVNLVKYLVQEFGKNLRQMEFIIRIGKVGYFFLNQNKICNAVGGGTQEEGQRVDGW